MEEKSSNEPNKSILSVLTKKKNTTKKVATEKKSKDEEAAAKVQELLKNTPVASLVGGKNEPAVETQEFDVEAHKQERSQKWLEDQVNELSRQIEEYENEIIFYKQEMQRMQEILDSGETMMIPSQNHHQQTVVRQSDPVESSMNHTLVELFKHFENLQMRYNHDGNFAVKLSFPASGNGILDKFLEYFPQLHNIKRYNNRQF
jgi:hypothetical protein